MTEPDDLTIFERALRSSKRQSKTIDLPGWPGVKTAILVPTDEELAEAQAATLHYLTSGGLKLDEFKLSLAMESALYEAEYERQLLVRVLRSTVDTNLPFATIESLRRGLTAQSRKMIMRILSAWVEERSPETRDSQDPVRQVDLVRSLKAEGALSDWLMSCDFATLVGIVMSLAGQFLPPILPSSSDIGS